MFNKVYILTVLLLLGNVSLNFAQDAFYGEKISSEKALNSTEAGERFNSLKIKDTLYLKFTTKVNSVCKMKGCWMFLDVPGEEVRVTFKDYGFFVPKDIEGREVTVAGKAYLNEISVEDQRHYAEDEGKNEEEIGKITKPSLTKSFEAHGVILKK